MPNQAQDCRKSLAPSQNNSSANEMFDFLEQKKVDSQNDSQGFPG
jgi:hypothetical protein